MHPYPPWLLNAVVNGLQLAKIFASWQITEAQAKLI